jgi:hypothetical protein
MMLFCCLTAVLAAPAGSDVALHDFDDISVWSENRDGGHAPAVSADTEFAGTPISRRIGATSRVRVRCRVTPMRSDSSSTCTRRRRRP